MKKIKKNILVIVFGIILIQMTSMYLITAKAATEAPNQEELHNQYNLKKGERSSDNKYIRSEYSGDYYATIYGYSSAPIIKDILNYLDAIDFRYSFVADPYSGAVRSNIVEEAESVVLDNASGFRDMLLTKSGREALAMIGYIRTDWINPSWEEAADLTFLHAFGVINDDFNLVKYDRNKLCSREDFYTMYHRFVNENVIDGYFEQRFKKDDKSRKEWEKSYGKKYTKRNALADIFNNITGYYATFYYGHTPIKFMKKSITQGEVYALIGNADTNQHGYNVYGNKYLKSSRYKQRQLIKAFNDITMDSFYGNYEYEGLFTDKYSNIKTGKIAYHELDNLWTLWKAGVIKPDKNGNINLQKKMT